MAEQQVDLRDRFRGTLLGLAVGDALGAPLEFQTAREPASWVTDMIGGGWLRLPPGHWTDDTEMALCVVESLLARRVFDPDDIAQRFVAWLKSGPADVGNHTSRVLSAMRNGEPWERASAETYAQTPNNAPNGSLMRCAPLSMFLYRRPEMLEPLSAVLSRITHAHPDCEWSCVCVNVVIAHLLLGASRDAAFEAAVAVCEPASAAVRERLDRARQPENRTLPTGWVLDTLEVALWCFLHGVDYESSVLPAVNRGSDADTVGAVTGAMAGAAYGASRIPQRWTDVLYEREKLESAANQLLELAQS